MRFLITGVNGVVGRNLFELLRQNSALDVYGTGRSKSSIDNYIQLELTDETSLLKVFADHQFDAIIHCAALIAEEPAFDVFSNNLNSTLNIVKASLNISAKKIFYISSISVIGNIIQSPITEQHKVAPLSTYAYSKYQCEKLIKHFCNGKIQYISLRIPSPVGKKMPLRSVFPIFLNQIKNGKDVTLTGDSKRKMSFLDLRDLSDFISQAIDIDNPSGVFNLGGKTAYTNFEIAKTMIDIIGSHSKVIDKTSTEPFGISNWNLCHKKIKSVFDFEPRYSLVETIEWILSEDI